MNFLKVTFKGFSWMFLLRLLTRLIAFMKIFVLARLLLPKQFGVYGIAALALSFVEIITEFGMNVFLIQEGGKINKYLNSAWFISILRGILITLILLCLAPFISSFFNSAESLSLLISISVVPFIKGFINPSLVKFQKDLDFKKEFWFRFVIFSFDSIVSVLFALSTRSASSLIWGLLAGSLLELFLSFYLVKPRPKFDLDFVKIRRLINRGKWVTLYGLFNFLFEHTDDIFLGKILGSGLLGLYQMAYKVAILPLSEVSEVFIKVTFPSYVKIRGSKNVLNALLITQIAVTLIVIPLGVFIYVFSDLIVRVLLGPNWTEIIQTLRILSVFGIFRAITHPVYAFFLAINKQEFVTYTTLLGFIFMVLTIFPLISNFGMYGAAISVLISSIATLPVIGLFIRKSLIILKN